MVKCLADDFAADLLIDYQLLLEQRDAAGAAQVLRRVAILPGGQVLSELRAHIVFLETALDLLAQPPLIEQLEWVGSDALRPQLVQHLVRQIVLDALVLLEDAQQLLLLHLQVDVHALRKGLLNFVLDIVFLTLDLLEKPVRQLAHQVCEVLCAVFELLLIDDTLEEMSVLLCHQRVELLLDEYCLNKVDLDVEGDLREEAELDLSEHHCLLLLHFEDKRVRPHHPDYLPQHHLLHALAQELSDIVLSEAEAEYPKG